MFRGAGQPLELVELRVPQPQAGEAVVRIECCTICGSDLHTISGARQEPTPSILGHEILGTVAQLGDPPLLDAAGDPLRPGDRLTWSTASSCGACDRCQRGLPQKCRMLFKYGHAVAEGRGALSGGLAEYILLRPGTAAVRLPAEIADEVFCPVSCATATISAAFRAAGESAGLRVLIFGAGMLGLTAAAYAASRGAARVAICDLDSQRLARASRFGADRTILWESCGDDFRQTVMREAESDAFDVVLELSGSPDAVEAACELGDVGARIVLVGSVMKSRPVQLDPERVVRQWSRICGVHNYAPQDLQDAVEFLTAYHHRFPFAELVEAKYSLEEVNRAVQFAREARPVRVAIQP